MRLLVCGGRDYADSARVFAALDAAHARRPISVVIHGACRGADMLADAWAERMQIERLQFLADWSRGPQAGPERNQRMLEFGKPDGVCVFPGGRGTADMLNRALSARPRLPVWTPYG